MIPSRRLIGIGVGLWLMLGLLAPSLATGEAEIFVSDAEVAGARAFTVRVTSNRSSPTVSVRIDFPPNLSAPSFPGPPRDWGLQEITPDSGGERTIGMFVRGGEIADGDHADFEVIAGVSGSGGVWRVEQTYADRVVDVWEGGATLADVREDVVVTPSADAGPAGIVPAEPPQALRAGDDGGGLLFWLGLLLLAGAVAALVGAAYIWSSRPGRGGLDDLVS